MDLVTGLAVIAIASWATTAALAYRLARLRPPGASRPPAALEAPAVAQPHGPSRDTAAVATDASVDAPPELTAELTRLLRIQRHGFINQLQVISGWLQLGKPERALQYIDSVRRKREQDGRLLRISNWRLLALLLDKTAAAETAEVEVDWRVDADMERVPPALLHWLDRAFDEASAEASRAEADRTVRGRLSAADGWYEVELTSPAAVRAERFPVY